MKISKSLFLAGLLSFMISSLAAQDAKEVAAIKATIEKETLSFFNVNQKDWEEVKVTQEDGKKQSLN